MQIKREHITTEMKKKGENPSLIILKGSIANPVANMITRNTTPITANVIADHFASLGLIFRLLSFCLPFMAATAAAAAGITKGGIIKNMAISPVGLLNNYATSELHHFISHKIKKVNRMQ